MAASKTEKPAKSRPTNEYSEEEFWFDCTNRVRIALVNSFKQTNERLARIADILDDIAQHLIGTVPGSTDNTPDDYSAPLASNSDSA